MRALRARSSVHQVVFGISVTLLFLASVAPAAGGAPSPSLVKDIVIGGDSNPMELTGVGATLFFTAAGAGGRELWKSDGTGPGTVRVKNIRAGANSSSPMWLTDFGGILYFSATDGSHGRELWKSDGTPGGTTLVKDINTNGSSNPAWFLPFGDRLYFSANDGIKGMELWRTDGTPNGTKRVKDIRVGSNGSSPSELTRVGTRFFFATDVGGGQLWKSDGTASGTVLVEALGDPFGALTKVGSNLFFAGPPGFPPGLWKSNGTAAGTMQIDDTTCGFEGCHLTNVGGIAYVSAFSDDGLELVRSNGTVAGTYVVKDINPGEDSDSWPEGLINVSGKLMFYATTDAAGQELWKSNGTEAGTKRVAAISPILTPGSPMAAMGGIWYGEATHNVTHEDGLWSSNGTEPGTELIMEFVGVGELTPVNGVLYFWAHDGVSNHGRELWKYLP